MKAVNNHTSFQLPASNYRQAEYLILLLPPERVSTRVLEIRKLARRMGGSVKMKRDRPHILLAKFNSWHRMEEKLLDHIRLAAMGQAPFRLELGLPASFPKNNFVMPVSNPYPLLQLVQELDGIRRLSTGKVLFTGSPAIALAEGATPAHCRQMLAQLPRRRSSGAFLANSLLVLRRFPNQRHFQLLNRFEFQYLPVATRQGVLFA